MKGQETFAKWLIPAVVLSVALFAGAAFAQSLTDTTGATDMPAEATPSASATAGLSKLQVVGVGTGALSLTNCGTTVLCATGDTCRCLTGTDSVEGSPKHGTGGKGTLTETISVDVSSNVLPIGVTGGCFPASGIAMVTNNNTKNPSTFNMTISGLVCDTNPIANAVLSGTYMITGGTGKFSTIAGAGNFSESQVLQNGAQQVALTGSIQ